MTTKKCEKCGETKPLLNEPPSQAALHGHILFRNKPMEAQIDLDNKRDLFKVYAHNKYLFSHYDKQKAIRRAEALGYYENSVNFVML